MKKRTGVNPRSFFISREFYSPWLNPVWYHIHHICLCFLTHTHFCNNHSHIKKLAVSIILISSAINMWSFLSKHMIYMR